MKTKTNISQRFRGYLPVVVDIETGGLNPQTHALLEIAAVILAMNEEGKLYCQTTYSEHVIPFPNAKLDKEALELNKIDPTHPFRFALDEKEALQKIFDPIRTALKETQCQRAILVGHNAWFDLLFLKAAIERCNLKNPFHAFTTLDTASLGALAYGQTVLARIVKAAGMHFNPDEAHSAIYDAERTADLFCHIVNTHNDFYKKVR